MGNEGSSDRGGGDGDGGDKGNGGRQVEEGPPPLDKDYPADEKDIQEPVVPDHTNAG